MKDWFQVLLEDLVLLSIKWYNIMDMRILESLRRQQLVTEYIIYPFSDVENYQVKLINVPSASKEDVLVVSNKKILPHWVESKGSVWTKIPKLIKNTPLKIYTLTGNVAASDGGSIGNTFIFGDDFLGSSIDASKWTIVDATGWSVSGGELKGTSTTGRLTSIATLINGVIVETRIRGVTTAGNAFSPISAWASTSDDLGCFWGYVGEWNAFWRHIDGAATGDYWATALPNVIFQLILKTDNTNNYVRRDYNTYAYIDSKIGFSKTISGNEMIMIGTRPDLTFTGQTYLAYWDWVRVRKYIDIEPIVQKVRTLNKSLLLKELMR